MILIALFWGLFVLPTEITVPLLPLKDLSLQETMAIPSTFHYLGSGRQMIAFESPQQKLVLKLFRRDNVETPWYLRLPLPDAWFKRKKARLARRQSYLLQNYRLALQYLSKETGIVCVHQGISEAVFPQVTLQSLLNHCELDLNKTPFILQKKGNETFLDALQATIGTDQFRLLLQQFFAFHRKRISFLIGDSDRDIQHNYQMLDGKLLYIDAGGFFHNPNLVQPEERAKEWWRATHRLRKWLERHVPEELAFFDACSDLYIMLPSS